MLVLEDRDLIRWCGEQGIGVVSYGPLAYGLLTGAIRRETTFDRGDHRAGSSGLFGPTARGRALAVVDALRPIADRLSLSLAQLAIAWNVHQPGVTAAIAGSRDAGHVRSNAAAGDATLDPGTLDEIDAILSMRADTA
jgi:aryl-alcohol dehydrogenase-like predicted oxidoreductase